MISSSPVSIRRSFLVARAAVAAALLFAAAPEALAQKKAPSTFNVIPITFTDVIVEDGALVAIGNVGTTSFRTPLNLIPGPAQADGSCPILDLQLGPINLTLLGLNVDTSPICLEVSALEGGGLLGDLLCEIANLLNGGAILSDVLNGLDETDLNTLSTGLSQLLTQAFAPITSSDALLAASCDILNLSLGPLELNLLGLVVELDDCNNGPVTVDITATPGGGLLGDLLCDLADLLNTRNPNTTAILTVLRQVAKVIGGLVG